jgi:isoquinoline 1-oxidoreductase alpha subunit
MKLTVNGKSYEIDVPPEMPLLWALRDIIGLTGTKFGCGTALCGACTVHLDGAATRSCITPVSAVGTKEIRTIEGLARDGKDHPVQEAWAEANVPQCGYCQAGQLMTAAALVDQNARPSAEEIDAAMTGNLCRCGTYLRIRKAVARAAEIKAARAL